MGCGPESLYITFQAARPTTYPSQHRSWNQLIKKQQKMATAHILAIPFPLQGHINPTVQLCNRLSSKGIHVTFVTTASIGETLQTKTGSSSNELINVETVPDFKTHEAKEGQDAYENFFHAFRAAITSGLPNIIGRHRDTEFPVRAIVYDSVVPWVLDLAHENGLKGAMLFTQSCTVCSAFFHMHLGTLEVSGKGSEVSLPGMPVMGFEDLPSLVYDGVSMYPSVLRVLIEQFSTFEKADWRLINTFDKLEDEILKWMRIKYPILTIGPTIPAMYTDNRSPEKSDYSLSLFKAKSETWSKWLEEKVDKSVVYVSFGSMADLPEKQMEEIALGLIATESSFLWVIRDSEQGKLPSDFSSHKNGLIVNWCSQLEVLSHRAVGCFLTHGGWNSVLEGLSLGVPMVVLPQWTDQPTNAKLVGSVWGTGIQCEKDGDGIVGRDEVKGCVEDVMRGERGKEVRRNAAKWKDLAVEAVSEGGSSDRNVGRFAVELGACC